MNKVTISEARRFSLEGVQRRTLSEHPDLLVTLICFEAGQSDGQHALANTVVYQVLEGEALVKTDSETNRLGKGKLLAVPAAIQHTLENAGGGLLVVLATQAR